MQPSNPLLTSLSSCLRESVVYAVARQLWLGQPLATSERVAGFPSKYREGFVLQEIAATLLSLALRLHVQRSSLSAVPCKGGRSQSIVHEDSAPGYFSISPSASELAITNASYAKLEREDIDYSQLVNAVNMEYLLYIRESLLPFFSACNIKVAPQLNKHCHNSLKLSMDYHIQLEEAAILVIDCRDEEPLAVDDSVGVVPEFLLDHLCITGSLEHVKESRTVIQSIGYLVTIRTSSSSTGADEEGERKKLRSNITSKCYLGLDAIAMHVTLPLLMVSRHTSQSIHHWRKSLQVFKPSVTQERLVNEQGDQQGVDSSSITVAQSQSWLTAKSLVSILSSMEKKKLSPPTAAISQSKQATPRGSQRNMNISTYSSSPNYPLSIKALGAISKTYGLEEPDVNNTSSSTSNKRRLSIDSNSSQDSPNNITITIDPGQQENANHGIISSGSHGIEPAEDTTDSPQLLSSDPEAPIQASMATYTKNGSHKISSTINPVDYVPELSPVVEMPNMNKILAIPDNQLEFSVYGSVRVKSLQVSSQVGTLLVMLEVRNISGAIDCRQIPSEKRTEFSAQTGPVPTEGVPILYKLLPTYLSVSSTLQQCCIRVFDSAVSQG